MSNKTKQPKGHYSVVSKTRKQVQGTSLERYNTNDLPKIVHAVAFLGHPENHWNYTAFDDEQGGLRHLTFEEAIDIVASHNKELGWTPGQLEGVIVYN